MKLSLWKYALSLIVLMTISLYLYISYSIPPDDNTPEVISPSDLRIQQTFAKLEDQKLTYKEMLSIARLRSDLLPDVLDKLKQKWRPALGIMLLEIVHLTSNPLKRKIMLEFIAQQEKLELLNEPDDQIKSLFVHYWNQPEDKFPDYHRFKSQLYSGIDPRFAAYFKPASPASIRLDEIRWGGVMRDGIPPLKDPEMLHAQDAHSMHDSDIIFGVFLNGQAKAYPKRILGWHEMVKDHLGETSICGVYCTLCGSMIVYDTKLNGQHYELGTSGFLYRSNKLMYDHATESLWSTLEGTPVVGSLVNQGITLTKLHVVTTTWQEWKQRHPETLVLSFNTGHQRDYGEGVAYRDYFADDKLMFPVPNIDTQLKNKTEVLALSWESPEKIQLAIDTNFLRKHPLYQTTFHGHQLVILTDKSGASRVYDNPHNIEFVTYDAQFQLTAKSGTLWEQDELQITGPLGEILPRHPQHQAFWFGWKAAFPQTELIK